VVLSRLARRPRIHKVEQWVWEAERTWSAQRP
jgi:hypothetical protein